MVTKRSDKPVIRDFAAEIAGFIAGACLVVALLSAGFAASSSSLATRTFSTAFASYDVSPFLPEDLVNLAVATRDYTVKDCGRSSEGVDAAREDLSQLTIDAAQRAAAPDSPVQDRWNAQALTVLQNSWDDPNLQAYALADVSDRYALSSDALKHLDDCYALIGGVIPWLVAISIAAAALLVALVILGRRKLAGTVLFRSPIVLAAFMIVCGIWAAIDFNGFFGVFHAILFPQGNWTFPADSLLICMLPLNFWVSMGALWLAVTVLACIIAMLLGKRLMRHAR